VTFFGDGMKGRNAACRIDKVCVEVHAARRRPSPSAFGFGGMDVLPPRRAAILSPSIALCFCGSIASPWAGRR
jgi:hypothetical protein